jgi:hypothetical protein
VSDSLTEANLLKTKRIFKEIQAEKPDDLSCFVGRTLTSMDGSRVKVERIVGSMVKPTRFEINGMYHIVILDAYKQLNNDKSITQAMIDDFDKMVVEHIEKVAPEAPKENDA